MITAREAKEIAGPSEDEIIEIALQDAEKIIRANSEKKRREAHLYDGFWANEGYSKTEKWKKACEELTKLGFEVSFFYEERQFVNMYTLVKW